MSERAWLHPWKPVPQSEPPLERDGAVRVGSWLWEVSFDDGRAPYRYALIPISSPDSEWHLLRADGMFFWQFCFWSVHAAVERLNVGAMRAVALFCWRRGIGGFPSIERHWLSWGLIWKALRGQ
jgi:hypothetical protein